tara:strand:- start:71 stop:685 length:615 start_codon:yes stop_codon:yes gene_type:complete
MAEENSDVEANVADLESPLLDGSNSEAADPGEDLVENSERDQQKLETDFALKLVDTLVGLNEQVISNYELTNTFFTKEEVHCFGFFARSVPLNPLPAIYPENGFLIFKGVAVPKSVNLASSTLAEIEKIVQASESPDVEILHLSDLAPDMLNAYEMANQIYNDKLGKVAATYMSNVKNAKAQVVEISAAVVCGFVILLTLASLL